MDSPALSIVIPCYNEAGNIPFILASLRERLADRTDVEVVLVNNGSSDESSAVLARELQRPEHAFAVVCDVPVNKGYGYGICAGLRQARGRVLAWTHADMQTDPRDVLSAFARFSAAGPAEQVFLRGRRRARNPLDAFFTFGMTIAASAALGVWLNDVNAQPKMFHRSFFESLDRPPDDFSLDLYVLYTAKRRGMTVLQQDVIFGKRLHGQAKGGGTLKGKWKLIKRTWAYIIALRKDLKAGANAPTAL